MNFDISLTCAIIILSKGEPSVLLFENGLPSGPFDPRTHRTFETALRSYIKEQIGLEVGYVEQLYTFGDRGRVTSPERGEAHSISVGYLALSRFETDQFHSSPLYSLFPWEDTRKGVKPILKQLRAYLEEWANNDPNRLERLIRAFGQNEEAFDEEKVLERYELLYSVGLLAESWRDGKSSANLQHFLPHTGRILQSDHRRIIATALSRLRGKLKYRPVIFELMPAEFTLTSLQHIVEAIAGHQLHKQNFRRLVEGSALVEATQKETSATGGRPAALYRFRREVLKERPSLGFRIGSR